MDRWAIVKILEEVGARQIQDHARNIQCCCFMAPYRKSHRYQETPRASMGISIVAGGASLVHCLSCDYSSLFVTALIDLEEKSGKDLSDLIARAKEAERLDPDALIASVERSEKEDEKKEKIHDESVLDEYNPGCHKNVMDRGFTRSTLAKWDSRWDSKFKRVVFPVRNVDKALVGAVGRTVVNSKLKYFNYFNFNKSRYLFGEHLIKGDGRPVIVVEGLLDTILLWQYFSEKELKVDVVGLLGSDASRRQLRKIVRHWDDVVLFLDNDPPGWAGQRTIMDGIQRKVLLRVMSYPKMVGGDPAELVVEGVNICEMLEKASLAINLRN